MEKDKINLIKDDSFSFLYNGKKYEVDLTKELKIDEATINTQLKDLPSNYLFLCLQRDKAIQQRDKLERERDEAYSKAWIFYKDADSRMNNEMVSHKASTNQKYISLNKSYQKAAYKANKLISICKAYESRERILQTLSANLRKQS